MKERTEPIGSCTGCSSQTLSQGGITMTETIRNPKRTEVGVTI